MKKLVSLVLAATLLTAATFAQVLSKSGVKNTMWTGFGEQYPEGFDKNGKPVSPDTRFYGLFETLQARIDVSEFTVEGMLNWAAETNWKGNEYQYATFANTQKTPFYFTNNSNQGGTDTTGLTDSYYVNFIWNAINKDKNDLDFGMGTRLAWRIGPAPSCNGYYWEPYTHIAQGGLKEAIPGGADVAGYIHYDNIYANHALGIRYRYDKMIEAGVSIPDGVTTDDPFFNAAFAIQPMDSFRVAVAFYDVGKKTTDFYSGLSLYLKPITLDAYIEINDIGKENDERTWGTGATVTWYPVKSLLVRPEAGATFYSNNDYTPAFYTGGRIEWAMNKQFTFGGFSSLAWGSKNLYWTNNNAKERAEHGLYLPYETTKNWNGGFIFDVRPDVTYKLDANNSFTADFDYQYRVAYTGDSYSVWASGVYWTYRK